MAMTVMKVVENAFVLACTPAEVNRQHASARLQNATHLDGEFWARFRRQMMKHQRAQRDIELPVGKRQRLCERLFEHDFDTGLSRFLLRARDHLRRRVNAENCAVWPDLLFGGNGETSSAASHVQD